MQGIFRKENTDKALKYGIYRHLPTYEKIIRNLVSFLVKKIHITYKWQPTKESFQKDKYYTDIKKYIINCKLKQNIYL